MSPTKIITTGGLERWVVNFRSGKRTRRYFQDKPSAMAEIRKYEAELKKHGQDFARLTEPERAELMLCYQLAKSASVSPLDATRSYIAQVSASLATKISIGDAVAKCLADKESMGIAHRSLLSLRSTITRLSAQLGPSVLLCDITRSHLKGWLVRGVGPTGKPWSTPTRNGYMTDINTFMNWAVDEEYIAKNPITGVKDFKPSDAEIVANEGKSKILQYDDVVKTIRATWANDKRILAHVVIGWFAGLRPERELAGVTYADIHGGELHVRPSLAKTRQDRYIKMSPNLIEWVKFCAAEGIELPAKDFDNRWEKVRKSCGLWKNNWPHDGARHTFASNYLAVHGETETIKALGHGNYDMLFKHYRTLIKESDGLTYFDTRPSVLLDATI